MQYTSVYSNIYCFQCCIYSTYFIAARDGHWNSSSLHAENQNGDIKTTCRNTSTYMNIRVALPYLKSVLLNLARSLTIIIVDYKYVYFDQSWLMLLSYTCTVTIMVFTCYMSHLGKL